MSQTWNPEVYLRYETYRARPALDLLAQIPLEIAGSIVDLGCGPGNVTQKLKEAWPDRNVMGVDMSEDMLAKARASDTHGLLQWQQGDIATWEPESQLALVFSNAALHWVPDHTTVLPRLTSLVLPEGWLAFQIPVTEACPYQTCIRETVTSERWADKLAQVWMYKDPMQPEQMYDILSPFARSVDIWVTDYHHVLEGENPVFDWIIGTGLTPYLSVLSGPDQEEFLSDYSAHVLSAYPKQTDGKTLFLMKRIFVVAQIN
ncbi:MAG: methyltransferase domain-containing protein [Rhodospirillaceae bacterium]